MNTRRLPAHVDRLNSLGKLRKQGFEGPDANLAICLAEYGIAWREMKRHDANGDSFLFVYSIGCGRFDRCGFKRGIDPEKEWDWVNFDDLAKFNGMSKQSLLELPFTAIVLAIHNHLGYENTFGSQSWEGFQIAGVSPAMKYEVCNLDDEDYAREFLLRIGDGQRPATRIGMTSHKLARSLRDYARLKLLAISRRKNGYIEDAITLETQCEGIYDKLPPEVRW